jgi:hypothetical protein
MLMRAETEDLKTSLLRQCPGPPECRCKFCATRGVIAAYERVAALHQELVDFMASSNRRPLLAIEDVLRKLDEALEGK